MYHERTLTSKNLLCVSREFIESRLYSSELSEATRQEEQIEYLVISKIQENHLSSEYIKDWTERKFQTNDHFLNYIKSILKQDNFLTFTKYMRKPLPSSKLINNKIKPQLARVFNAEDCDFRYDVTGIDSSEFMPILSTTDFNTKIFDALFNAHNSIVICELDQSIPNSPFRYLIEIDKVKSINPNQKGYIDKIAFSASVSIEGKKEKGTIYIDNEKYEFWKTGNTTLIPNLEAIHDLGYCPAHFITDKRFGDSWVMRESIFSYIREELEEYNFLKTIQKMTEPNGAIPIITKLLVGNNHNGEKKGLEPEMSNTMQGQQPFTYNENPPQGTGLMQPGTIHEIPIIEKTDGSIDMEAVKNFVNFHYMPVESLKYLDERIKMIERSIVSTIVGDVVSSNEESKNQLQIEKSISVLENTLSSIGRTLSIIRRKSDSDMLGLKYGIKRVKEVFAFFGTDFFLDSQYSLFQSLEKAPNAIERKNIIVRINQNKYKNNIDQLSRQKLLYELLPYVSDKDFEVARLTNTISVVNLQYQIRFNYWISKFEAIYGDIVSFYRDMDMEKAEKLLFINNLIIGMIEVEIIPVPIPMELEKQI